MSQTISLDLPPPKLISPNIGSTAGGATTVIQGHGFGDDGSVEVCGTIYIPEFSRDCAEDEECGHEIQFNSRKSELRTREDACFAALKKRVESFLVDAARQIDGELQQRASA